MPTVLSIEEKKKYSTVLGNEPNLKCQQDFTVLGSMLSIEAYQKNFTVPTVLSKEKKKQFYCAW